MEGINKIEIPYHHQQFCSKHKIKKITAGGFHSFLLTEKGEIYGCGYNGAGQVINILYILYIKKIVWTW